MTDKVQKILSEIATRKLCTMDEHMAFYNDKAKEDYRFLSEIEEIIKDMQEEPISEELKECKSKIILEGTNFNKSWFAHPELAFIAGANWQREQMMAKAVDGYVIEDIEEGNGDFLLSADYLPKSMNLKDQQCVKVIVIKED